MRAVITIIVSFRAKIQEIFVRAHLTMLRGHIKMIHPIERVITNKSDIFDQRIPIHEVSIHIQIRNILPTQNFLSPKVKSTLFSAGMSLTQHWYLHQQNQRSLERQNRQSNFWSIPDQSSFLYCHKLPRYPA